MRAARKAGGWARSQTAARSAAHSPLDLLLDIVGVGVGVDIPPRRHGIGRDDLHRLVELLAEAGRQVGMAGDHGVHRVVQPVGVESAGDGEIQLHRIEVVVIAVCGVGVEEQSLLQGGQRQHVSDPVVLLEFVDLLLAEPCGGDIRRGQPAAAAAHMRADADQGVKPQLAEPADLCVIQGRGRPHPVGVQVRADLGVHGAGVELDGVSQRQGQRRGRGGDRQAVLADPPQSIGEVGRGAAQTAQIVKPDRRVRPGHVHIGVQIAQHTVGQTDPAGPEAVLWRP